MKQTNNAIKFLMAQYRAIFQNAYFKGLATAAVVTMGLAAGQAQATRDADWFKALTQDTKVGSSDAIAIAADASNTKAITLTIESGATHAINGGSAATTVTAKNATIKIAGSGAADATKLVVSGSTGGAAKLDVGTIKVENGTLELKNNAANHATVEADFITLGKEQAQGNRAAGATAVVSLASGSTLGKVSGTGGTTLKLLSGSEIKMVGAGAAAVDGVNIKAADLQISGGAITLGNGTKADKVTITISDGSMTDGSIAIAKQAEATISAKKPDGSNNPVSFDVTGGKLEVSGKLTVDANVAMTVGDSAKLYTKTDGTSSGIEIASGGVFKTSKEALLGLTTGKNSSGETYVTGAVADKGGVNIAKGGVLYITGDNVSLKGLTLASGGNIAAKSITSTDTAGDSTLKFDSLVVDEKVANSDKFNVDVLGTLTLGAGEYAGGASNKSFNQINAKSLAFNATDAYDLAEKVVLASADSDGKAAAGTISGDAKLGEILTINQGNYTQDGTLKIGRAHV